MFFRVVSGWIVSPSKKGRNSRVEFIANSFCFSPPVYFQFWHSGSNIGDHPVLLLALLYIDIGMVNQSNHMAIFAACWSRSFFRFSIRCNEQRSARNVFARKREVGRVLGTIKQQIPPAQLMRNSFQSHFRRDFEEWSFGRFCFSTSLFLSKNGARRLFAGFHCDNFSWQTLTSEPDVEIADDCL